MEKVKMLGIIIALVLLVAGCSEKAGNSKQEVKPDNGNVELDSLSPYYYDKEQKEVTFSDDSTELLRFPDNSEIEEYVVPENVTYIQERAFMGCQSLKRVTIPASVKEVGMAAFENCHSLRLVYLYARLDTLPFRCFNGCDKLREIRMVQATPPVIEEYEEEESASLSMFFGEVNLKSCRIIVPKKAASAYRKAYGWRLFKNIEPIVPHHIYLQRDSDGIFCYADSMQINLPDWNGTIAMATYEMGNYAYVVGDQCPNGKLLYNKIYALSGE